MLLKRIGYDVTEAFDGQEAVAKFNDDFDLDILDYRMPNLSGLEVLKKIRESNSKIQTCIMTADVDEKRNKKAI